MKKIILLIALLSGFATSNSSAQIISNSESDTLMVIINDTILDYGGTLIGSFDNEGFVYNSNSEVIGKFIANTFYDLNMAEIGFHNAENGELTDYNGNVIAIISTTEIRNPASQLLYSLINTDSLKATGILFFFFK